MTCLEKSAAAIIYKRCTYDSMGPFGMPNNPGDLLVKYGKDCNYSIRDKSWHVEEKDGALNIKWETQETPISNVPDMIEEAMQGLGKGIKVNLNVYDRSDTESCSVSFIVG